MMKATVKNMVTGMFAMLLTFGFVFEASAQYKSYGEEVVIGGDFAGDSVSSAFSTFIAGDQGASATLDASTGELVVSEITSSGAETWHIQFNQVLTADQIELLKIGSTYELSFKAKALGASKDLQVFFGENGGSWTNYVTGETLSDSMTTYNQTFVLTNTFDNMKLGFEMGKMDSSVVLDDIMLRTTGNNIVYNGDFSNADSIGWVKAGGAADPVVVSFDNEMLNIIGIPGTGASFDVKVEQWIANYDSLYTTDGDDIYELSFDAKASVEGHNIHAFIGHTMGAWDRYFSPDEGGNGRFALTTEMKNYKVSTSIDTVWTDAKQDWAPYHMQIAFEVNYGAADVIIDNVSFYRINDVPPAATTITASSLDGVQTLTVEDNGAASYDIYFSQSEITNVKDATSLGSITSENLTITHSVDVPHQKYAGEFTAYYAVVARSAKGASSPIATTSVTATSKIAMNYIYEVSDAAVAAVSEAISSGVIPAAGDLASFFPDDYKPFEIDVNSTVVNGAAPESNDDLSGKFWVAYEKLTGNDFMIIYAEIKDDIIVPTAANSSSGGAGWNDDSYEVNLSNYAPDPIEGSTHTAMKTGDKADYQLRIGLMKDSPAYVHAHNATPNLDSFLPNSATIADTSFDGGYRTLSIIATNAFNQILTDNGDFSFPSGTDVSVMPFLLSFNDDDGNERETQIVWGKRAKDGGFWNNPTQWDVVALVGSEAAVSNEDIGDKIILDYTLDQNYPNPFNPSTTIQFSLAAAENVTLEVYNMLGQKVATLLQGERMAAGNHMQKFDASSLASGMYVYRISTPNFVQSRTMMLIK
jgi:hypothetical protein